MKILHVVPSFYPATRWGGPIFSTKAICDGISADPDVELRVLTTDAAGPTRGDNLTERPVLTYPIHYARRVAGHSIAPGLLARLPAAIAWADVVHLTATYSFPTLPTLGLARLLGTPVVWSPRGALLATADWAEAPNRPMKHRFEKLAGWLRPRDTVLHATSNAEATRGVERLGLILTSMIPNAVDLPQLGDGFRRAPGQLRLMFLSRLHPKKGLDTLIDAMGQLPDYVTLDVYGSGDPDYVERIGGRAAALGGRIRFRGHVDGAAKANAFASADLFVLPTHSENFGIAVAEALAHGLPVITTTAAPWRALEAERCGRCIDLATSNLAAEIIDLSKGDLTAMGARGRAWMARDFSQTAMVEAMMDLYRSLMPLPGRMAAA